jgi:hypothetical protein
MEFIEGDLLHGGSVVKPPHEKRGEGCGIPVEEGGHLARDEI